MPAENNLHSLPSAADTTRVELDNGIIVLARTNPNSRAIAISGYLQVGALLDPIEKLGLSDFTSLAVMRGTQSRDHQQLFDALESAGASFGYSGGTHTTGFGGKALAEDLPLLLEILSETLRTPTFPEKQIERLRAQILTHLAIQAQDTAERASLAFDSLVYAGHPYSLPEEGTPETIENISRSDLHEFHASSYGPRGMVIAIVGGIDPLAAVEQVQRYLGDWHNPDQPAAPELPPVKPLTELTRQDIVVLEKSQADLIIGAHGPRRSDAEFIPAAVGNSVLGQFGMYGRIGETVREKHGLAYYAYSSVSGGIGPGPWYIAAGADPHQVDRIAELILAEVQRFIREPVTDQELADCQDNFIGRLPLSMESNSGVAAALINLVRYGLDMDYYLRYPGLIRAVTPQAALEAARRFLDPQRLAIATAGPAQSEKLE